MKPNSFSEATFIFILICCLFASESFATSLNDVLNIYALNSPKAKMIRIKYKNDILEYENYKKSFLPSISLGLTPLGFNRNFNLMQNPVTGEYSYVHDYSNSSSTNITVSQKIGITGGYLSLSSSLGYLREFSIKRNSFSSSPIYISYNQPLLGGYRLYKQNKALTRLRHEYSIKEFCNSMSSEQNRLLSMYLDAYSTKLQSEMNRQNILTGDTLLRFAKLKLDNGVITKYEYNRIELQQLQAEEEAERQEHSYREKVINLCTELGIESLDIESPQENDLPPLLDEKNVLSLVHRNSPRYMNSEIQRKQAEYNRMQTMNSLKFNGDVSLSYGMNQYGESLKAVYSHPEQRQSISITLKFPVFQWGINNNKRKMAENEYRSAIINIEQSEREFDNSIKNQVEEYHSAYKSFLLAKKAFALYREQYSMTVKKFSMGKNSLYDVTADYKSLQSSIMSYSSSMQKLYTAYYTLRHLTLYDFAMNLDLENLYTKQWTVKVKK